MINLEEKNKEDVIVQIDELNKKYEQLLKKNKRRNIIIILLGILMILLIILLVYKIGRIGFSVNVSGKNEDLPPVITLTDEALEENNSDKDINTNNIINNNSQSNKHQNNNIQIPNNGEIYLTQKGPSEGNVTDNLNIFKNMKFGGRKIIAPNSKGIFKFYVNNGTSGNISYNLSFIDEMSNIVNMKYKLKIDGEYIKGNANQYVSIEELNIEELLLANNSYNLFELEWYWEDDDKNDTFIGSLLDDQYYELKINIVGKRLN